MAEGSNVSITISGDAKEFKKSVDDARKLLGALDSKVQESGGIGQQAFSSFLGNLSANAISSFASAAVDGLKSLASAAIECVNASAQQDEAQQKLNFALANTGRFTEDSAKSFADFATELSKASKVGDEVILANAALIQSYTNLSEEGLKRATQASLDFSTVTGKSMEETSVLIAKAAEGNIESLRRYGIFVESTGDKAKDYEKVLEAIEKKSSGAAAASAQTFAGAQFQLANALGEVQEELGSLITQNPVFTQGINLAAKALQEFQVYISQNKETLTELLNAGYQGIINATPLVVETVLSLAEAFFAAKGAYEAFLPQSGKMDQLDQLKSQLEEVQDSAGRFAGIGDQQRAENAAIIQGHIDRVEGEIAAEQSSADRIVELRAKMFNDLREGAANFKAEQTAIIEEADAADLAKETAKKDARMLALSDEQRLAAEKLAMDNQLRDQKLAADLEALKGNLTAQEIAQLEADTKRLNAQGKFQESERKMEVAQDKAKRNAVFEYRKFEEMTDKEKLAAMQGTFQQIATLQSSSNSTLFGIGKAFAIADATINGAKAVQLALGSAPPPFNFVLAGLVGAASLVNIQKIASTKPPTGAADGALVTGGKFGMDTEPFMLSKGEVVAPARSFDEVVEGTARQRGMVKGDENADVVAAISRLEERIVEANQRPSVVIQGEVIGDELYINRLVEKIRDAVEYRGAKLGVA